MRIEILIALLIAAPALAQQPAAAPPKQVEQNAATADGAPAVTRVRFSDRLATRAAPLTEAAAPPRVDVRTWAISERQTIKEIRIAGFDMTPGKALVIYNLRAGELTTIVNGKRIERQVGDFWSLKRGETQSFETGDDSAVVETIVVEQK